MLRAYGSFQRQTEVHPYNMLLANINLHYCSAGTKHIVAPTVVHSYNMLRAKISLHFSSVGTIHIVAPNFSSG
ncbi:hypothetical protein [Flavobacterium nackdongense]|uniref:Uncharacterized protein n=1 Tax=Flavobacterium nackdongense TaxID=2547394 RepID=A0A4P6YB75_9FLAO|nr:hypothetical protein [Flavobacterium nackdongense]QBN17897.1 hypothetical protein E1750_03465 [Flavobacterium nackdongense]